MNKRKVFAVMGSLVVLSASAFDTTGYVVASSGGSKDVDPFLTPSCWTWPSGTTPDEMDPAAKYYSKLKTLSCYLQPLKGKGDFTVPGTELVLERNSASSRGLLRISATSLYDGTITFNNLIVNDFTCIQTYSTPSVPLSGKLTVQSSQDEPFLLWVDEATAANETRTFSLTGMTIVGDESCGFDVTGPGLSSRTAFKQCYFKFDNCDMTGFEGRLRVRLLEGDPGDPAIRAIFSPTDITIGGELLCEAGGGISLKDVTTALTVKCLTLEDGAVLQGLGAGRTIVVEDTLSVGDKVYLDLTGFDPPDNDRAEIPILTCGPDVDVTEVDVAQFVFLNAPERRKMPLDVSSYLTWTDGSSGGMTLQLVLPRIVERTKAGAATSRTDFEYDQNASGSNHWTHAGCPVTDGAAAADTVYYNNSHNSYVPHDAEKIYEFPGRALVLGQSASLNVSSRDSLGFDADIVVPTWSKFSIQKTNPKQGYLDPEIGSEMNTYVWSGTIRLLKASGSSQFYSTYLRHVALTSVLSGEGDIYCRGQASKTPSAVTVNCGSIELTADNSAFTGRIRVGEDYIRVESEDFDTPNEDYHMRLIVSDGKALGGMREEFAFDALALEHYSRLAVRDDVVLAAGLKRGVSIGDHASFWVPAAKTLTVNQPLNLCGELTKTGAGTLELGGTAMTFGADGKSELPIANSNRLTVAAGTLRITNAAAADGAEIVLAEGAKLLVGLDDTAGTALRSVKAGSSLTAAGGAIPVAFDTGDREPAAFSTVICTSGDATLRFACVKPWKGFGVKVTANTVGNVTTYTASSERMGLKLLFY